MCLTFVISTCHNLLSFSKLGFAPLRAGLAFPRDTWHPCISWPTLGEGAPIPLGLIVTVEIEAQTGAGRAGLQM